MGGVHSAWNARYLWIRMIPVEMVSSLPERRRSRLRPRLPSFAHPRLHPIPLDARTPPRSARSCRYLLTRRFLTMRFIARAAIFLLTLASAQPLLAQGQPIKITGVVELSGAGATSGTNFNDGVKLAVKEINAAGGILGRRVEYTSNHTQSEPQVARALAVKAIDDGAYVVMGPVFSGSILVSMAETKRAEITN